MNSVKDIVAWAAGELLDWEADIVRRLLNNKSLSPEEQTEVINNVMVTYGLAERDEKKRCAPPSVNAESIDEKPATTPIKLCSIKDVNNVNAIVEKSTVPFSHDGITIIYGENGSGKSGYTRILKNACFAKYVEDEILPNVYKENGKSQSATITLIKNGQRQQWSWAPGRTLSDLADINVYDSESGKVLLEKNNQVTYKPKGVEIFDSVPGLFEKLKEVVAGKSKQVALPKVEGVEASPVLGRWLENINVRTTAAEIEEKTRWSDGDAAELAAVVNAIQDYENGVTLKKIARLKSIKETRWPKAVARLSSCLSVLPANKVESIAELERGVATAKAAYDIAVKQLNTPEPLPGIHSEAWKTLFKAAKEYSEQHAYEDIKFPNIDGDAKCVLCMQPLSVEGKVRMSRFDSYIANKSKTNFDEAVEALNVVKLSIEQVAVPEQDVYEPLCADLVDLLGADYGVADAFKLFWLRKSYFEATSSRYPIDNVDVVKMSESIRHGVDAKLAELQAAISEGEYGKNVARRAELQVKKSLFDVKESISNYHVALQFNAKVSQAQSAMRNAKLKFSNKAKSIISAIVTPEFVNNFEDELKFMGVSLAVKITPVVRDVDTSHAFTVAAKKPGKVLSEGEQKVISIAAFLAEIKTFRNGSPIVLDDPVSSLDHVYREKIAHRLALEAEARQVIIFTHDLSLVMEIEGKCEDISLERGKGPARSVFTMRRNGKDSGFCHEKAPWRGIGTAHRAQQLTQDVHAIKALHEDDVGIYNREAAYIYCLLRESWESLVEQDLFNQVVTRGRNSVQTTRLSQLSVLPNDINVITHNMTKTSSWMFGHDKAKPLTENRPSPAELLADIAALESFSRELIDRRKSTEKSFKEQLKPPVCEVG